MNNLFTRAISGALYVVLLYLTIWYGPLSLILFFVFLTATGLSEFYRLTDTKKKKTENRGLKLLIGSLVYLSLAAPFLHFPGFDIAWLNNLYIPLVFSAFFLVLFSSHKNPVHELTRTLTGFIYVVAPLALAIRIPVQAEAYRPELLLGIFILIWCSDTFAYLVGSRLGKTPLAPRLSPKKTWEGSIGGLVFALGAAFLMATYFPVLSLMHWLILAAIVVVFGTFGDLAESLLKRKAGVKDSGTIMPGHGGILDRLDSFLFAVPFVYFYLQII